MNMLITQREIILEHNGRECAICGKPANQLAHCIAQTGTNLRKYGKEVVHHWNNLIPVCSLQCNDRCNVGNNPGKVDVVLSMIRSKKLHTAKEIWGKIRGKHGK